MSYELWIFGGESNVCGKSMPLKFFWEKQQKDIKYVKEHH